METVEGLHCTGGGSGLHWVAVVAAEGLRCAVVVAAEGLNCIGDEGCAALR